MTLEFGLVDLDSDFGLVLDLEMTSGIGLGVGTPTWTANTIGEDLSFAIGPGSSGLASWDLSQVPRT